MVLVGPNNSGKSSIFYFQEEDGIRDSNLTMKILSDIRFILPKSDTGIDELLNEFKTEKIPKDIHLEENELCLAIPDTLGQGNNPEIHKINKTEFVHRVKINDPGWLRDVGFLKHYSIFLDGRTRFTLIDNKPRGDLKLAPSNPLSKLYMDDKLCNELDKIVMREFEWHFYLDPTLPNGILSPCLSKNNFQNRRSLNDDAIDFFKKCIELKNFGDGIQVYVGLLIAVLSLPHKFILLDEPEAFLHPPKARTLGSHVTAITKKRDSSLIVSTHSPDFLLGCLDESKKITIIRLTYDGVNGTTRQLSSSEVEVFTTDPLLRSVDTISSLFHSSAIISESDRDRVFYTEINRRMKEKSNEIEDAIFLNSQGKHTIHRIFGPLRKIGVPAAAIYDLDVVKYEELKNENSTLWQKILETANVSKEEIARLEKERAELETCLKTASTSSFNAFTRNGIESLSGSAKDSANKLLDELKKYGIFIIPIGNIESWSDKLVGNSFEKTIWLVNVLQELEKVNPQPSDEGIWKFLTDIKKWIINHERLGMN